MKNGFYAVLESPFAGVELAGLVSVFVVLGAAGVVSVVFDSLAPFL